MTALVVRPLAEADLDEAFAWYESRSVGLGVDFLRTVDACFAAIVAAPLAYPVVYRGARRALLRRFPYAILYVIDGEQPSRARMYAHESPFEALATARVTPNNACSRQPRYGMLAALAWFDAAAADAHRSAAHRALSSAARFRVGG